MHWRVGRVSRMLRSWTGAAEYEVVLDGDPDGRHLRALAYLDLVGTLKAGERVLLNVSALELGLGTGGMALVVAPADRLPPDPRPGPGHLVKARYTPQQQVVLALDEQESAHHEALTSGAAGAGDLQGLPVVAADLHSALPAIVAGIRTTAPRARVVYLMSDGGALPAAFSMTLAGLRDAGWLAAAITVGQAFGGDHEAITLHSGLLAARHVLEADVAVVIQGPGNAGTGTPFGYSGVAAGEALNAVHTLGGLGIAALRISAADPRERHYGISHHSRTAYGRLLLGTALMPVPALGGDFGALVATQAERLVTQAAGTLVARSVAVDGLEDALAQCPVRLSSMGRSLAQDREYFLSQAAAGRFAAGILTRPPQE